MKRLIAVGILLGVCVAQSLGQPRLRIEQIMQDPKTWIGAWPSDPFWSEDGQFLYFWWNPKGQFPSDSLFKVARSGGVPEKVSPEERRHLPPAFDGWHHGMWVYDADFRRKVFVREGDLYLYDRQTRRLTRLTRTVEVESTPRFTPDGQAVVFVKNNNLFQLDLRTGGLVQLTDLRRGSEPRERKPDGQDAFLQAQQRALFEVIRKHAEAREAREKAQEQDRKAQNLPPTFYYGEKEVTQLQLDPTGRFVTFALTTNPPQEKSTAVMDYVTESGYAQSRQARPKVGVPPGSFELYVQDLLRDTTYLVNLHQVPGAYDVPEYLQQQGIKPDTQKTKRFLYAYGPYWSGDGHYAVLEIRARDNKDRWIARLDPQTGQLTVLDRQHDEAWIAGPGISWFGGRSTMGWLPDNRHFYFQSERTGYSHLYVVDVETGQVRQLTDGPFEVFDPFISRDGRYWYFTSSEGSPFERHFYRMPIDGGPRERLTTLPGRNDVVLSPDEQTMGILYSYSNRPPEIYLQPLRRGRPAEPQRLTHSPTEEWLAYPWRDPEIRLIEASDGARVPARVYEPDVLNGAAVFFVHGAGYLQNVHRWWSSYFREYMFHNLLADLGYLVLDLDYRGSAGYGRNWRTAIYRHMGGRDLQDYVDASRYVQEHYGIPPERVFIYGGSYGGFLTLMALFTASEHFGGGAALRAVTDWAHYNHPYTSNILNTPETDSLAYVRSSPIYHAEGLQDPLLMCHGLVDTNVQPQDIFRLVQRLIELGKENWELAVYPVEGHGFEEPSSWTDQYKRILKLIEVSVGPNRQKP
uniref:S9 family peptidase n=1 Tax=Rhodothermus marinus TaxID=29549 RepID=A0A7V2B2L0_RHOMR